MANDDDSGDVPAASRIARSAPRPGRTLSRFRVRERFARDRRPRAVAELMGRVITRFGLTDATRQQCVCLFWPEIAGRFARKTWPVRFADGVLHIETESSSWVHELQFHKATLIAQVNAWVAANQVWLGPPPLAVDLRFELGNRGKRTPLVDRPHAEWLRARQIRRLWKPREVVLPSVSEAQRAAIRAEAETIADPELRAVVESVRIKWDC